MSRLERYVEMIFSIILVLKNALGLEKQTNHYLISFTVVGVNICHNFLLPNIAVKSNADTINLLI